MNEFVKLECACDAGYDKGAVKKTLENNIFSIFGNLNQKSTIIVRYHGMLTEHSCDENRKFNIYYYFDNDLNTKKIVELKKCCKCIGDCYCASINLDMNHLLNFGFFDDNNNYEIVGDKDFELTITPEPISALMQRYGFEDNIYLPTCDNTVDTLLTWPKILNHIKAFFNKFLKKFVVNNPS